MTSIFYKKAKMCKILPNLIKFYANKVYDISSWIKIVIC